MRLLHPTQAGSTLGDIATAATGLKLAAMKAVLYSYDPKPMAQGARNYDKITVADGAETMAVLGNVVTVENVEGVVLAVVTLKEGDYVRLENEDDAQAR